MDWSDGNRLHRRGRRRSVVMGGARVLQLFRDASGSHTIGGRGRRRHRRRALVAKLLDAVPVYHRRNDRRGWEFSLTERRTFRIALPRGQPISLHIVRAVAVTLYWRARRDSNPQPSDPKSRILGLILQYFQRFFAPRQQRCQFWCQSIRPDSLPHPEGVALKDEHTSESC